MGNHDGKVVISTALDNNALRKGINNISGSLGGLKSAVGKIGGIVAAAFSVKAIVDFSRAAIGLGSDLEEVQNVVDVSFGSMKAAAEDFASTAVKKFGMSELAAKRTSSTYMAMAKGLGVAENTASDMAISLAGLSGDVASFYNLDQEAAAKKLQGVFTGESEALKELGVVMTQTNLKQFAMERGMNANIEAMSQAELVALRYAFVTDALSLAAGDFERTQNSWANQTRILSMQWQQFMGIIGQTLTTVLTPAIQLLNNLVSVLITAAQKIQAVTSALFGKAAEQTQAVAQSATAGAVAQEDFAKGVEASGKAAKKAEAGFDELNVLQAGTASGSGAADTAVSGGEVPVQTPATEGMSAELQKIAATFRELAKPLMQIDFTPAVSAFSNLKAAMEPLKETLFDGLKWGWNNILVPLAEWTIEDAIPAFLDLLSAALSFLNGVIDALKPMAKWLWDEFLSPIAEWTAKAAVDALDAFSDGLEKVSDWVKNNKKPIQVITGVAAAFMAVWTVTDLIMWVDKAGGVVGIIKTLTSKILANTVAKVLNKAEDVAIIALYAKDYIVAFAKMIGKVAASTGAWIANTAAKVASTAAEWAQIAATTAWNAICTAATAVTTAFGAAVSFLTSPIGLVVVAIAALIAIVVLLVKNWDKVKAAALSVWSAIKTAFGAAAEWFKEKVLDPLSNGFKKMVNGIIGFLNSMISGIVSGINGVIKLLNKLKFDIPDWVPGLGGKTFGFNMKLLSTPQIPYLAQGAVLPPNKPFMAVVGDQRHGTNVEAPLATIQEALANVLAAQGRGDIKINFTGDLAQLARVLKPVIEREDQRVGTALVQKVGV